MNTIGVISLSLLISIVLWGAKRWAFLGLMSGVLYLTLGQVVDIFGLHFYAIRILSMSAFLRVFLAKDFSFSMLNRLDKIFILVFGYRTIVFILNGNGNPVTAIGLMVDVSCCYLSFRYFIQRLDDFTWFLKAYLVLLAPYLALLIVEMLTGKNQFAVIGGITELVFRNGRPRCLGSFGHASIMGTFGASFLPLYIGMGFKHEDKKFAIMGVLLCLGMVLASNSGGPLGCVAFGLGGWLVWTLRTKMYLVTGSIWTFLIFVALTMKAPVWYLPDKLSIITGGDGWHRSYLMDIASQNIDKWGLAGMSILETKNWFAYVVNTGGADIINYYLDFGISAGVVSMCFFIWYLNQNFKQLGESMAIVRGLSAVTNEEYMLWALGVVLAIHVFNWFGMVYFDQFYVVLMMQLAAISSLTEACTKLDTSLVANNLKYEPTKLTFHRYRTR